MPGSRSVFCAYCGEFGEVAFHFLPHAAERNAEHALAALEEVDYFIWRGTFVHARAVAHQGNFGQITRSVITQVMDCCSDLIERDTSVEQSFHDLQGENVAKAVQTLRA